jgi:hypothetical protein
VLQINHFQLFNCFRNIDKAVMEKRNKVIEINKERFSTRKNIRKSRNGRTNGISKFLI